MWNVTMKCRAAAAGLLLLTAGAEAATIQVQGGAILDATSADAVVTHHAAGLSGEHVGVLQLPGSRDRAQLSVGLRGPEEIAQSARELTVGNRLGRAPHPGSLDVIEEIGRNQHAR